MNPKDSTRTRLVLDTHRLVLDSYSENLDSIQHYLLAKRLFSLSFCVSFPPLLPCSRFCSSSLCRRCRPSSQREERYLGFLRSSLSRSSCRRGGGQRKEDFVRGPTGEEAERERERFPRRRRTRAPPPPPPLPPFAPSVPSARSYTKREREKGGGGGGGKPKENSRKRAEVQDTQVLRPTERHRLRCQGPQLQGGQQRRQRQRPRRQFATGLVRDAPRPGDRRQAGRRAAARRRNRTPESFLGTLSAAALRTHPRRRLSPESSQTG